MAGEEVSEPQIKLGVRAHHKTILSCKLKPIISLLGCNLAARNKKCKYFVAVGINL